MPVDGSVKLVASRSQRRGGWRTSSASSTMATAVDRTALAARSGRPRMSDNTMPQLLLPRRRQAEARESAAEPSRSAECADKAHMSRVRRPKLSLRYRPHDLATDL